MVKVACKTTSVKTAINLTLTGASGILLVCVSFRPSRLLCVVARIDDSWTVAESKLSICEIRARVETEVSLREQSKIGERAGLKKPDW